MGSPDERLDDLAFLGGIAALGAVGLAFLADRNGAACVMTGFCLAGLCAARLAGVSGVTILPVAVGLALILYVAWIYPPGGPRRTSFFAHVGGGALAGYALAVTLRGRLAWPAWGLVALVIVIGLTLVWELGEYVADEVLETALVPSRRDSAQDIVFGCAGGALGILATWFFNRRGIASRR